MNRLNKTLTQKFLPTPDFFSSVETEWKTAVNKEFQPSFEQTLIYSMVRGKDWKKSFSFSSNEGKKQELERRVQTVLRRLRNNTAHYYFVGKDEEVPHLNSWCSGEGSSLLSVLLDTDLEKKESYV